MKETLYVPRTETRVLLVNSSQLYARSLQLLFDQEFNNASCKFSIVQNSGPEEVLNRSRSQLIPVDLILLCCVPANFGLTLQVAHALRMQCCGVPVLWLEVPDDPQKIKSCIRSGARGFTLENTASEDFKETLCRAVRGEPVCPAKALPYLFEHFSKPEHPVLPFSSSVVPGAGADLTRREQEVLNALAERLTNREIGERLNIELRTVKNHVHNILGKLQISSRHEAALLARQSSDWRREKAG